MKKLHIITGTVLALAIAAHSHGQTIPLVVPDSASCATSVDGSVVGVRNPLQVPQTSVVFSGTLPAATYFIKITWYDAAGNQTLAGPETQRQLVSTGSIVVQEPSSGMPNEAVGMRVYMSTSANTETLQGSVAGSGAYTQSVPLVTGAALPSSNTTLCEIIANDAGWPSGTGYDTVLTSPNGSTQPGYPMQWQFLNPGSTYNLSQGLPLYNGTVTYPIPIMARPYNHGPQSISGPLSMTGYKLTQVSYLGVGTNNPAWGVDAEVPSGGNPLEGVVNAATGFLVNGGAGTLGQGLCSDGNYLNSFCNFLTALPTLYYQTVIGGSTIEPQRGYLAFDGNLLKVQDSTVAGHPATYIYPNLGGNGSYFATYASLPGATTHCAEFDGAGNLVPSGQNCFNGSATLIDYYWTETDPCSSGSGNTVACLSGGSGVLTTHLPGNMPDASYTITCSPDTHTFTLHPPALSCGFINANDGQPTYSLPTTAAGNLYYQVVQILDNGGSGGSPVVYFHAHHD
jgi:hypothetical protein